MAALRALRMAMQQNGVKAFVVPSSDPHMNEYICPADKQMEHISNFHGSNGTLVILENEAALWTDGRYFLQASKQLDSSLWTLMKQGLPDTPSIPEFITEKLDDGDLIGLEGKKNSMSFVTQLLSHFKEKDKQFEIKSFGDDVVTSFWPERPEHPSNPAVAHPIQYTGKSSAEKLTQIRQEMAKKKTVATVVAALDEIAWLLNIRGSDISFNPIVISYVIVTAQNCYWFVAPKKVTEEVRHHVEEAGVEIRDYKDFFTFITDNLVLTAEKNQKIWVDPATCNYEIVSCIPKQKRFSDHSPVAVPKGIKNEVEIQGLRNSSLRDSAALVEYFSWLNDQIQSGNKVSECEAADKLQQIRSQKELYVGESFETISSTGANAAIIHYKPEPDTCEIINNTSFYLCDSGAQYLDGTTDITRTLHFGQPSPHEKRCFTRVLQGHINLASAVFPSGTTGHKLDVLARTPLWEDGLDYAHGTGHGFGCYLNVHEAPMLISSSESTRGAYFSTPIKPGMTVTIEPGYYEDNKFGIRIENDTIIVKAETQHQFQNREFYTFEVITWVPIQSDLIDTSLLSPKQLSWINEYNAQCRSKLQSIIKDETVLQYLNKISKVIEK